MNYERNGNGDQDQRARQIANELRRICGPDEAGLQRLSALRARLLTLLLDLDEGGILPEAATSQSVALKEGVSKLIWMVEDCEVQVANRN